MSEATEPERGDAARPSQSMETALRIVRDRQVDRDDVVVDMKAAEEARLGHLAEELQPLLTDIPDGDDRFEFAISHGERPRFWVDMTSHVSMGHDRRTYRFLKDTRMGRVVLGETGDVKEAADHVALYIAEKIHERERAIEGEWTSMADVEKARKEQATHAVEPQERGTFWRSMMAFLFGVLLTVAAIVGGLYYIDPSIFS